MSGARVTETQKRSVSCPVCDAKSGRPCAPMRSSIPGYHLENTHPERRAAFLAAIKAPSAVQP